jgi:hypothetical protein
MLVGIPLMLVGVGEGLGVGVGLTRLVKLAVGVTDPVAFIVVVVVVFAVLVEAVAEVFC